MNWHQLLTLPENLIWAWRKVKHSYLSSDVLYDHAELAAFELCLEAELQSILECFKVGRYELSSLKLVPQPKKPDKNNNPRLRQYFQLKVRDQVAWMALVNVIGPELDQSMPAWSYGNRLYRAAWYENESLDSSYSKLNKGPYRHASGKFYRHFKHSWPLYRRHISLTARKMAVERIDVNELERGEQIAFGQRDDLRYFDDGYWRRNLNNSEVLYAASLDLEKFYPSIKISAIWAGFEKFIPAFDKEIALQSLIKDMLIFNVDDSALDECMRQAVEPPLTEKTLNGIPTGLFVGGFLANVAMLPLDSEVEKILNERRDIAHFRYVDDHEFLAYDFPTLCTWISNYEELLKKFSIGPVIEKDKYSPPELRYVIHGDCPSDLQEDEIIERVKASSSINGRKPTELMTRTLTQVSMLAGTNFDLLSDAERTQRQEQLEWLLLANIPDQEIRGDTRAAFAASRIATLTPTLFKPNDELLLKNRECNKLINKRQRSQQENEKINSLKLDISILEEEEKKAWNITIKRYFGLLFEAFIGHPDKVRLFIKLFDYCRITGYNGFPQITNWMTEHKEGKYSLLRSYLGAMALHTLCRHVLRASADVGRNNLLHRERAASVAFLKNVAQIDIPSFSSVDGNLQGFQCDSLSAFSVSLLLAAEEISNCDAQLREMLRNKASTIVVDGRPCTLGEVRSFSGYSIGVWIHWKTSISGGDPYVVPEYWERLTSFHNIDDPNDWSNLRRHPTALPVAMWDRLTTDVGALRKDDEGWLFDASRANPAAFSKLSLDFPIVATVNKINVENENFLNLINWVEIAGKYFSPNDPRGSEWTGLEIIRQILESLRSIENEDADFLDTLHPANVLIPNEWKSPSLHEDIEATLTWEGWRKMTEARSIKLAKTRLHDYRYSEFVFDEDRSWPRRLRGIGQLLWGILKKSFCLPSAWNIRGQERGFSQLVASDLERFPISSCTLSLLRSSLLYRNRETAVMTLHPELFAKTSTTSDDTEFDLPIPNVAALLALISRSQRILMASQMTVLEHAPRQLIPVHLKQLSSFSTTDISQEPEF